MKCSGLAAAKEWTDNLSCKSCSEVTAANDLTVPDTVLIDPATSHSPERSVAAPTDNFLDNLQPHHAVTVREIYREVVAWKPSFFTLSKNKTGKQFTEAHQSVLSPRWPPYWPTGRLAHNQKLRNLTAKWAIKLILKL